MYEYKEMWERLKLTLKNCIATQGRKNGKPIITYIQAGAFMRVLEVMKELEFMIKSERK